MKLRMRKGFTLIELLVVIAIIGILAALIIVSLTGARGKAQDTQRKNNARNLDTALEQYYVDKQGFYPGDTVASLTAGQAVSGAAACNSTAGAGVAFNQNATSDTLFGTYGYIANTTVCNDPGTLVRFYLATPAGAGPVGTKFALGWQLASQSEIALNAGAEGSDSVKGNGIYGTHATTGLFVNGLNDAADFPASTKLFVVYGPQ